MPVGLLGCWGGIRVDCERSARGGGRSGGFFVNWVGGRWWGEGLGWKGVVERGDLEAGDLGETRGVGIEESWVGWGVWALFNSSVRMLTCLNVARMMLA